MALEDTGHRNENLNIKSFYGRLLSKIWIIPLAALFGALLGFGIYFAVTVVYAPARSYETSSMLYLVFAQDETGEVYDYYNGYTWNQLMATDEIINTTMDNLKKMGIAELASGSKTQGSVEGGVTKDEVIASTTASVPSDLRYLVITIDNTDKDLAQAILIATDESLIAYGDKRAEFTSIKLERQDDEATLTTITNRTGVAAAFGAAVAVVLVIIALMLIDALDDAIYVPEDAERRYHLPVLGMLPKDGQILPNRFKNELVASFQKMIGNRQSVALLSIKDSEGKGNSQKITLALKDIVKGSLDLNKTGIEAMPLPGATLDSFRQISECDGVILAIAAADKGGAYTEHVISQLHKHDCPVIGIIMTDADMKFIKWYYSLSKDED